MTGHRLSAPSAQGYAASMRVRSVALALVLAGCSGRVTNEAEDAGGDAGSDVLPDAPADTKPDAPADCSVAAEAIARLAGPFCTTVLRLDYRTRAPLGWNLQCGAPSSPTEAEARKALAPYAPPYTTPDSYALRPTVAPFPFVFHVPPSDFGAVGLVSRRTGVVAFAGGVVWSGRGEIAFPTAWRPATELAGSCVGPALPPTDRFLPSGELVDDSKAALDAAWSTALPLGLAKVHRLVGAFVLGYPRTVGGLNPAAAEWVIVIESSVLE